ncbi:MAG: ABC transporter permease [Gammaproteobacteria bacterium]|nr:ABC transporter permease [Gammaproteobacteria bacterium]
MIKPIILWTDALVFLLIAAVVAFALYARAREHLRAPWGRVLESRAAVISLVVLAAFVAVALLDSVHFRPALEQRGEQAQETYYSVEVLSLLDIVARPLKERVEKTYSAPFATRLYAREAVEGPDGGTVWDYPRLRYGGAHLEDPDADRAGDIARRALGGAAAGAALWSLFAAAVVFAIARARAKGFVHALARVAAGRTRIPWRAALSTAGIIIVLAAVAARLAGAYHIFGTDQVGQDVFYQAVKSIRTALVIGTLTTLVMLPFAILLGIMAGYLRGWIDDVIQYLYTTLNSIPGVLLIASAILMLQVYIDTHPELFQTDAERADMRLLFLCLILGVTSWTGLCRLLRGEALKLREVEYVQASIAFGVTRLRIMTRHLLPNVMHIVLISVVLDFSGLVLAEAVLSYVGVGVDPSTDSWGNMINGARLEMAREPIVWWSLAAAFVFMFALVLAANLFSDAVRDAFDPRLRGG